MTAPSKPSKSKILGSLGSLGQWTGIATGDPTIFAGGRAVSNQVPQPADDALSVPPPTVMPVPGQDTLEAVRSRRASIQAQLARRGRLSTILSQVNTEPLGGSA